MKELTSMEKDTIAEVGNISLGAAATALALILDREVDITTPNLNLLNLDQIRSHYPIPCLAVEVDYTAGLEGSNLLLIKEADANIIAALMMGDDPATKTDPLNDLELSAVQEAMNQMMGAMSTSMSELFMRPIEITPPQLERINLAEEKIIFSDFDPGDQFVLVEFSLQVKDLIDSIMIQVVPVQFAREMAAYLLPEQAASASDPEQHSGPEIAAETGGKELDPTFENAVEEAVNGNAAPAEADLLSELEKDTIAEVGNISLGTSATALAELLGKMVEITTPKLEVIKVGRIQEKYPIPCLLIEVDYIQGLQGSNVLLVREDDARKIAALMMGEDPADRQNPLSELEMSAVQEAMNQMMGSMATSMSEMFQRTIDISPPRVEMIDLADERVMLGDLNPDDDIVHVEFSIKVENIIDSVMVQVVPVQFAREMAGYLLHGQMEETEYPADQGKFEVPGSDPSSLEHEYSFEAEVKEVNIPDQVAESQAKPVKSFARLSGDGLDLQKLELVKDIPMDVTVVLGSARLPLGRLFTLGRGGIVELDCQANDPVEILANNRLLARGEVVLINDQLGVRITEIQFDEVIDSYDL